MGSEKEAQQVHIGLTDKQIDVGLNAEELELVQFQASHAISLACGSLVFRSVMGSSHGRFRYTAGESSAIAHYEADDSFLVITVKPPF
jgi:hypothetical protein